LNGRIRVPIIRRPEEDRIGHDRVCKDVPIICLLCSQVVEGDNLLCWGELLKKDLQGRFVVRILLVLTVEIEEMDLVVRHLTDHTGLRDHVGRLRLVHHVRSLSGGRTGGSEVSGADLLHKDVLPTFVGQVLEDGVGSDVRGRVPREGVPRIKEDGPLRVGRYGT